MRPGNALTGAARHFHNALATCNDQTVSLSPNQPVLLTALTPAVITARAVDTARASLVRGVPPNRPRAMALAVLASAPVYSTVADGRYG